jgi:hypothetical protein
MLAAILQSEEVDQAGRGLEHQLPQLYSHVGAIVVVQRATDEVVVGAVVRVVDGVIVVVVGDVELDVIVEEVEDEEVEEGVETDRGGEGLKLWHG